MSDDLDVKLTSVFEADRALRLAQQEFMSSGEDAERVDALVRALDVAWNHDDPEESVERLMRVGDLLSELGGLEACKALVRLLDHDEPAVRASAGEGLIELGQTRYAEVARVFEKTIEAGAAVTALTELPYILAELGEPGGVKLCVRLLKHKDGDVVAAAIEGLASLGDPSVVKDLEKLKSDPREVTMGAESDPEGLSVGDLASEAVEHLRSLA